MNCPRCGKGLNDFPTISRRDNKTEICKDCASEEVLFDIKITKMVQQERRWLDK